MAPSDPAPRAGRVLGFERLLFFSDAVFAIAITLLVLDLRPPPGSTGGFTIAPVTPNLVGFGLSFYVVGRYWLAHHRLFEALETYDRRLMVANLCFLAGIVFVPFPTSVVTQAKAEPGAVIFYTLSVGAVGALMIALTLVARRPALMRPGETPGGTARLVAGMAAAPLVFIASAALAPAHPRGALLFLLSLFPVSWASDRLGRFLQRRIDSVPRPITAGKHSRPSKGRREARPRSDRRP